jgi:hypothetical protein
LSSIGLWIRMEGGFNACGPNFNRAISGSCRTRTDCPQAAHLIGQSPVKLGSSDCPIRVAYGASGLGRCDGHHEMVDFRFRKRHGGLLRIRRERPSAERKCKQRHLRIKMKELMALGAGLPTIFQNREDVRPEGLRLPESTTARPR